MARRWDVFEGGPNAGNLDLPRVTMSPKSVLLLNTLAYEVLGSPSAVELRWEERTRTIGLTPKDIRSGNAFPLKIKGTRIKKGSQLKCKYHTINAAPFCRHFNIHTAHTRLFNGVDLDDDGTMVLEMGRSVAVGRVSR